MRAERGLLPVLLLAGAAALAGTPASGSLDLETLMAHFAASRGLVAEYREVKTLPLLVEPVVSEGVLYYVPPDRLVRFTRSPDRASMLIDGDRLRLEDGLGVEEIDLGAREGVRSFVDQLLLLFQGDLEALRRHYEVEFESDGPRWTLSLTTRSLRVRQLVREITMTGEGGRLEQVRTRGGDGELTVTTYGRTETDRAFDADEIATLFPEEGSPAEPGLPESATP